MITDEGTEILWQKLHDGGDAGVHAHMAADPIGVLAEFALHFLQTEQDRARMVQQALAGRGQVHAARVSVEQGRVEGGLQIAQALAHR